MRKSRIKPLRGLSKPQYRLRVGEIRVFHDINGDVVEVLVIVAKSEREAETQEVIITRHGKPAGVLIGFASEEDWFDLANTGVPRLPAEVAEVVEAYRPAS